MCNLPKVRFPHKWAHLDALNNILLKTPAHILSIRQIVFEARIRLPSTGMVRTRIREFYGIDVQTRNFGIYHPSTCLEAERNFHDTFIPTIVNRLIESPVAPNALSREEIIEWEEYLKVEPSLPTQRQHSHRLVLVMPKAWRSEEP